MGLRVPGHYQVGLLALGTAICLALAAPLSAQAAEVRLLVAQAGSAAEDSLWDLVKDSSDPDVLQRYLDLYPTGTHAADAHARIDTLGQDSGDVPDLPTLIAPDGAASSTEPAPPPAPAASSSAEPSSAAQAAPVDTAALPLCLQPPAPAPTGPHTFGVQIGKTMDQGAPIKWVLFSDNARCMITSSANGTIKAWDTQTGDEVMPTIHMTGALSIAYFSPGSRYVLAYTDPPVTLGLWDAITGEALGSWALSGRPSVEFTPEGSRLLIGTPDGSLGFMDIPNGRWLWRTRHKPNLYGSVLSPDGRFMLSTSEDDDNLTLWTTVPLAKIATVGSTGDWGSFSEDSARLLVESKKGVVKQLDAASGRQIGKTMQQGGDSVSALISPDGRRVFSWTESKGPVKLWDAATGEQVGRSIQQEPLWVNFAAGSSRLLVNTFEGTVQLWDTETGRQVGKTMNHGAPPIWTELNDAGTRVFSQSNDPGSGTDSMVKIWDAATGEQVGETIYPGTNEVTVGFFASGKRLVAFGNDAGGKVRGGVWDASDGAYVGAMPPMKTQFTHLWADTNDTIVVTWTDEGKVALWNVSGDP